MSTIPESRRARAIHDSITLAISARASTMRRDGIDVVSLSAGEPDFPTPEPIQDAGVAAIREGRTRYTPAAGIPELRKAAADWFRRRFGIPYQAENISVTAGAKPALTLGLMAIVDEGDRVLLPAPFWASYTDIVRLAGGEPVPIRAVPEQGFVHTGEQIAAAARRHGAKGVVVNFPNNPSGAVASRAQLEEIVDAAIENDLWIVSDEIYARLLYDGREHVSPASFERAFDRVLVVNGGTKSHSMTGWRVGFLAGPTATVDAVARIQSQAVGNTCTISQYAAIQVCEETDDSEVNRRLAAFDERRRYLVDAVNGIDGLSAAMPDGAFYVLVDVHEASKRLGIGDDVVFAERLLNEARVAVIPGTPFEIPGFIRLSYAVSMDDLKRAVARLREFVGQA